AKQVVGIAGEDGDVVRDADAAGGANFGELTAALRVDREDRDRSRQRSEPLGDAALAFGPVDAAHAAERGLAVLVALKAGIAHDRGELVAEARRVAVAGGREVGELLEAAFAQMVEGDAGAGRFVDADVADAGHVGEDRLDVDDRDAATAEAVE